MALARLGGLIMETFEHTGQNWIIHKWLYNGKMNIQWVLVVVEPLGNGVVSRVDS